MKINLLIGATAFAMISSFAVADSTATRDSKAVKSASHSSAKHEASKADRKVKDKGDDTVDGPTDQGRNPDGSGDEVSRPYSGGGTNGTRD